MTSLRDAVRSATHTLAEVGVPSAPVDALLLAAHALGVEPAEARRLLVLGSVEAPEAYAGLVAERARRVPLQHLTGQAHFRRLTLAVGPGVFVPRPETETLVCLALDALGEAGMPAAPTVVDLCTGSGAVALALADEFPAADVYAVELDPLAHAWAAANRDRLAPDVRLELGDARTAYPQLIGRVDLVTCNPPYIPPDQVPVDPEVRDHDPALALYGGGADGLELPLAMAARAAELLRGGGVLVLEHADVQGPSLLRALAATGAWAEAADHADLAGRPRVLLARRARARVAYLLPVTEVHDCSTPEGLAAGVAAAVAAVRDGGVVVLPTDTVYGVGCDAFSPAAVQAVLDAKGRGRDMPPPVLVPDARTVDGLAREVPDYARALIERFWPGPLTLVLRAQSSLQWDLGDSFGTVAVRMPDHPVALELLRGVGPMAVTSANRTGMPPAVTAEGAREQLGDAVAVYLDGGPAREDALASTILDCTAAEPVVLREGALAQGEVDACVAQVRAAAAEREAAARAETDARLARLARERAREDAERERAADPRRRPGSPKVAGQRRRPH